MALDAVTLCNAVTTDDREFETPLGALYVAAALEELGVDVDWRDFQLAEGAHGLSGEPLARYLTGHARVVAISCFADMLPAVIDATRRLYQANKDTIFILGGPGPTASAERILNQYPWINGVVRGEGEKTISDWVRFLRRDYQGVISGMVYRDKQTIVVGPKRPRERELDTLPYPAYHLLDWDRYKDAQIITSRGCAYRCAFCDVAALWGNQTVYRGIDPTIAEMEMLRDRFGRNRIGIVDDTFVLNRRRVQDFCRMLKQRRTNIDWGCFARINLMTPDLIEKMAEAGCRGIFYGVDSGSQKLLDQIGKKMRGEEVMPVLRLSAQYFKKIEVSFIWGYPFETLDDFRKTLALASEASMLAPVVNVQLHMLAPLPLSPLYTEYSNQLLDPEPDDRHWLLLPPLLLDEHASVVRDLVSSNPEIYPGFFTFPTRAKRQKRKLLEGCLRALDRTIGRTFFDHRVAQLLEKEAPSIERELLAATNRPTDRIGVGLAIGFFRRVRQNPVSDSPANKPT
jgi:anaerobic magnesium-protoporphyrin IX monomethyl ester cyclase